IVVRSQINGLRSLEGPIGVAEQHRDAVVVVTGDGKILPLIAIDVADCDADRTICGGIVFMSCKLNCLCDCRNWNGREKYRYRKEDCREPGSMHYFVPPGRNHEWSKMTEVRSGGLGGRCHTIDQGTMQELQGQYLMERRGVVAVALEVVADDCFEPCALYIAT